MKIYSFLAVVLALILASFLIAPSASSAPRGGGESSKLEVRVSKSLTNPGESYFLYAYENGGDFADYAGHLDVKAQFCPLASPANCQNPTESPWGNRNLTDGIFEERLPANFAKGVYKAQWRPKGGLWRGKTFDWSNEVVIFVGRNEFLAKSEDERRSLGLFDTSRFWNLSNANNGYPALFKGVNNTYPAVAGGIHHSHAENPADLRSQHSAPSHNAPVPFRTVFDVEPKKNLCGRDVYTMTISKDKKEGYWGNLFSYGHWHAVYNNKFDLVDYRQEQGWHDSFLTSIGERKYNYIPDKLLNRQEAFGDAYVTTVHTPYSSANSWYPTYIQTPRWVAKGWGVRVIQAAGNDGVPPVGTTSVNGKQEFKFDDYCNAVNFRDTNSSNDGIWFLSIDILDNLSGTNFSVMYPGKKILKNRYIEGEQGYKDPVKTTGVHKEEWYLGEDIGLLRITDKPFNKLGTGSATTALFNINRPCFEDSSCLGNDISNPDIILTRYSLLDRISGDINGDAVVDGLDVREIFTKYGGRNGTLQVAAEINTFDQRPAVVDLNRDGKINGWDYVELLGNFGK